MESNVKNKKQQAMPKSEAESFGIKRNPAIRAPRIYLSEEEIIRIMRKETAIKKKIGRRGCDPRGRRTTGSRSWICAIVAT